MKSLIPPSHHPTLVVLYPNIMADPVAQAESNLANLLLDDVTGEKVSKSELKRRQKQRAKEAEKKAKAPAQPKAAKQTSAEDDEANLTPNVSGKVVISLEATVCPTEE